jgi:hypothetical protein
VSSGGVIIREGRSCGESMTGVDLRKRIGRD